MMPNNRQLDLAKAQTVLSLALFFGRECSTLLLKLQNLKAPQSDRSVVSGDKLSAR